MMKPASQKLYHFWSKFVRILILDVLVTTIECTNGVKFYPRRTLLSQ